MSKIWIIALCIALVSCETKEKYDPSVYYDKNEQKEILTSIVTYIFDAPPYTSMVDRFKDAHREFYKEASVRFSLEKYFIKDEMHYFFVLRPTARQNEMRGVGGHYKMNKDHKVSNFREVFVTPIMVTGDAVTKGTFLFDKMVSGEEKEFLKMKSYVQWPNEASLYDTTTYEWVLNKKVIDSQNSSSDSLRTN